MEEIRLCLVDFNQKEFTAKEVSWKVGTLGAWVQLDLNYVFDQMNNMAAGMTPMQQPMMQPGMNPMMMMNYQMPIPMQPRMENQNQAQFQNFNALGQAQVYNPSMQQNKIRPVNF